MRQILAIVLCLPLQAWGSETLVAGSYAKVCADQANLAAMDQAPSSDAIDVCSKAILDENLRRDDLTATYVNRGVLYLGGSPAVAERDFRMAIALMPGAGDAYADLGAAEIAQGRFRQAIADIDTALALKTNAPAKAYFNRAVAEDNLGDETAAYFDFREALRLKPGWKQAAGELARFTVKSGG